MFSSSKPQSEINPSVSRNKTLQNVGLPDKFSDRPLLNLKLSYKRHLKGRLL
jgi:hypothetical protein